MSRTMAPVLERPSRTTAPARSLWLVGWFRKYARRYVARHVHAVRLSRAGYRPDQTLTGPVIVVMNHPSWWDPMIGLVLSELWPGRAHFAPIDPAGLSKYRFLGRLGFFGVEPGTAHGARTLIGQGLAVLSEPGGTLWITAQGRFADPRERPIRFKRGVGHLAHKMGPGHVIPLALEYVFWDERTPEALARFGPPLATDEGTHRLSPEAWTARLEDALQSTQDALAVDALTRDPARFETLLSGAAGVGGVYDAWRRLAAVIRGKRFVARHGEERSTTEIHGEERSTAEFAELAERGREKIE